MKIKDLFDPFSGRPFNITGGVYLLLLAAFLAWGSWIFIPITVNELRSGLPVIRLMGGIFLVPLGVPLFLWFGLLKWLEAFEAKKLAVTFNRFTGVVALLTLVPGLLGIVLQPLVVRIAMPMYGYSICHKLQGSLSMWHNDWVRDPEWCVRGKSHEWVFEQAAEQAGRQQRQATPASARASGLDNAQRAGSTNDE